MSQSALIGQIPRLASGVPGSGVVISDPGGFTPPLTGPDLTSIIQELLDLIAAAAVALDDLTDVTITTPAENDTLRYISGEWVNDNRRWEPVTFNFGTGPELVWDGDDLVMEWKAY